MFYLVTNAILFAVHREAGEESVENNQGKILLKMKICQLFGSLNQCFRLEYAGLGTCSGSVI